MAKGTLIPILAGATLAAVYSGCHECPDDVCPSATNSCGGYSTSEAGSGGSTVGSGNNGGAGGVKPYEEDLPPSTYPSFLLAQCWVLENQRRMDEEDSRAGIDWYSAWWCGPCALNRSDFGEQAMYILKECEIYHDCYLPGETYFPKHECVELQIYSMPTYDSVYVDLELDALITIRKEGYGGLGSFVTYIPQCPYDAEAELPSGASLDVLAEEFIWEHCQKEIPR